MGKITMKDVVYLIVIVLLLAATVTVSVLYGNFRSKTKRDKEAAALYYNQKCAAFALENANLSEGQIVFIGDSITDGYHLNNHYNDLPLATYNRGIGGDTTTGVIARLKTSLFDIKPAKVVMLIGINDINGGRTNDEIMTNYKTIIEGIQTNLPATQIICQSVLPMDARVTAWGIDLPNAIETIKDLNARIKTYVESKGILFVDLFTHFKDENDQLIPSYSYDGLHPNAAGYEVWTSVLKPLLQ